MTIVLTGLLILLLLLVIGVPIVYTFAAVVIYMVIGLGLDLSFIMTTGYGRITSFTLICVPLFIIAGGIIERSKMGEHLIAFVNCFFGRFKCSLAYVSTVSCGVFGALSGSAAATLACIGSILAPKMKDAGYPPGFTGALFASASILGLMIPPSSLMIVAAWTMGLSVLTCFLSTVVPGIILIILLCVTSTFILRNQKIVNSVGDYVGVKKWLRYTAKTTKSSIPVLLLPVIILGGIYGGVMTPTESAAVGVFYAIIAALYIYRTIKWRDVGSSLVKTGTTAGVVLLSIFSVTIISKVLIYAGLPDVVVDLLSSVNAGKYVVLLMINLILIGIGMLMDDTSGVLICAPLFAPVAELIGVDMYHYIAIMATNLCMAGVTPPTAPSLYMSCRVCNCEIKDMLGPDIMFIVFAWIPTLILTTAFPSIALWLPRQFGLI